MEKKATAAHPILLVFFMLLAISMGSSIRVVSAEKTWCVAKPSSKDVALLENMHYACSHVDCSGLQPTGGKCFLPDALIFHASVAMNLYYQAKGRNIWNCYFNNTGLIVITDPSDGSCVFP